MICLRCPHTLRSSWERPSSPSPHHFDYFMLEREWYGTTLQVLTSCPRIFLSFSSLNKLKFAFNIKIIQPMERFLKALLQKEFLLCSSRHQIMILTNIFTELATGLTCFQIDFFFNPLVSCRNNFNLKVIS